VNATPHQRAQSEAASLFFLELFDCGMVVGQQSINEKEGCPLRSAFVLLSFFCLVCSAALFLH